jgi:Flp pilus assembly protein TadD
MHNWMIPILLLSLVLGCSSHARKARNVLAAPSGTNPAVATQLEKGNALFASSDFAGAEQAFRQTIAADSALAEAHYNLALTLDRAGNQSEAKKHYIEAANLAPGHKIIWDSPPFQENVGPLNYDINKKSFLDPSDHRF